MKEMFEYIDEDHSVTAEYYEILDSDISDAKLLSKMKSLINKDPYFFEPYTKVYDLLLYKRQVKEANKILDSGYKLALSRILDEQGNFPDFLEWGWLENRHIIRVILKKGLTLWQSGNTKTALDIFRNLFKSNPNDNVGVRYFILAILEGLSYDTYTSLYENDVYLSDKIFEWFEEGRKKYADEFQILDSFE
ncbi:hypothetical protein JL193_08590 [Polaribacter batillariae]|uniref:Tetratricopeptide repeat protein n=1 Tax=Polaribacter batillariae TaxID=2808900 RepID=A0ABX7STE7_9FLAO|nr:hypothetical protein [Polaribacter batillariae]QTD36226.1 hypothetical protein JL193_08590 [Polaribacter batillariae]